uniref:Uncharacterized protein n=1 Tax=Toxoplasma gondii COUG TaxID=1074873 RepID=A0A2G8YBR2_TOXGO|nr:hypothetical protein TGCOUG_247015 [Toxoplasma gondii COUG]
MGGEDASPGLCLGMSFNRIASETSVTFKQCVGRQEHSPVSTAHEKKQSLVNERGETRPSLLSSSSSGSCDASSCLLSPSADDHQRDAPSDSPTETHSSPSSRSSLSSSSPSSRSLPLSPPSFSASSSSASLPESCSCSALSHASSASSPTPSSRVSCSSAAPPSVPVFSPAGRCEAEDFPQCNRDTGRVFRSLFFDYGLNRLLQSARSASDGLKENKCCREDRRRSRASPRNAISERSDTESPEFAEQTIFDTEQDAQPPASQGVRPCCFSSSSPASPCCSSSSPSLSTERPLESLRLVQQQLPRLLANLRASDEEVERAALRLRAIVEARGETVSCRPADASGEARESVCRVDSERPTEEAGGGSVRERINLELEGEERPWRRVRGGVRSETGRNRDGDVKVEEEREGEEGGVSTWVKGERVQGTEESQEIGSGIESGSQLTFEIFSQLLSLASQPVSPESQPLACDSEPTAGRERSDAEGAEEEAREHEKVGIVASMRRGETSSQDSDSSLRLSPSNSHRNENAPNHAGITPSSNSSQLLNGPCSLSSCAYSPGSSASRRPSVSRRSSTSSHSPVSHSPSSQFSSPTSRSRQHPRLPCSRVSSTSGSLSRENESQEEDCGGRQGFAASSTSRQSLSSAFSETANGPTDGFLQRQEKRGTREGEQRRTSSEQSVCCGRGVSTPREGPSVTEFSNSREPAFKAKKVRRE